MDCFHFEAGRLCHYGEVKCATFSFLALGPDLSAHQLHQLPAYGETQARAAIVPGDGGIHLSEGLEELALILFGYAYPGILNREMKFDFSVSSWLRSG